MYSYHRNKIASMWHMQGKVTTVLMQVFFFPPVSLNVPEKKTKKEKKSDESLLEVSRSL